MLSVILPTYNEAENIPAMLAEISQVLTGREHEIIVVDDDSPDATWKVAEDLRQQYPRLRVLRRVDKRGLSSAVVDGFSMAKGDVLAVMDADGQHDCSLLAKFQDAIEHQGTDIAVGSRYIAGGSVGDWNAIRRCISKAGTTLAFALLHVRVKDPMSGFFAMRKDLFRSIKPRLKPTGFKILLDVLVNTPRTANIVEIPFTFGLRRAGDSKLSGRVQLEFIAYLYDSTIGRYLSPYALIFLIIAAFVTAFYLPRALALSDLYLSSRTRAETVRAISAITDREGWIRSDVELVHVSRDAMRIVHRSHSLADLPVTCFDVLFADLHLSPCGN